ncbi:hypothetical protein HCG51_06690 [Tolypothrix sp. PCC 7910]|uniref:hypothetical protein n=1 Tax=Tolypothrix sp. PCC 7910 TaxID=2099387 RepID=UPI00142781DB|nr:hypothetical protein [Tolypothrix sp. PCC 7910]QIR35269.1 hypothetical protein HCG51_06690 [Tolypothrix sp. PCC 7910]
MSIIEILELRALGSNLFDDVETFLNDLTEQDSEELTGGLAISQVTVSAGFAIFHDLHSAQNSGVTRVRFLNNPAVFHTFFRSHLNNGGLTVSIKTQVI